jgi:hypothetical protein
MENKKVKTEGKWHEPEAGQPEYQTPVVVFHPEYNIMWEYEATGSLRHQNSGQYLTSESYKEIRKIMSAVSKNRVLYITFKSGKTIKTNDYDLTRHGIYSFRSWTTKMLSWEELENYQDVYDYSTLYPFSWIESITAQVGGTILFQKDKVVYTPKLHPETSSCIQCGKHMWTIDTEGDGICYDCGVRGDN